MRDRLIELILKSDILCHTCGENSASYCADAIADLIIADGWIRPPCKVGDTVYAEVANTIEGFVITNFEFSVTPNGWSCGVTSSNGLYPMLFGFESIGKTVFLTKEEVEQKLKERNL